MRIGVTRADDGALAAALRARGAVPVLMPAIVREDVGFRAPEGRFDGWAFASPRAVGVVDRLGPRPRWVSAVGPATGAALRALGVAVDLIPKRATAADLLQALRALPIDGTRWLLPRAEDGRRILEDGLRDAGAEVVPLVVYRTKSAPHEPIRAALASGVDAVTFASGSAVRGVLAAVGPEALDGVPVVSIGPITTQACIEAGLTVAFEAESAGLDALAEAGVRAAASVRA